MTNTIHILFLIAELIILVLGIISWRQRNSAGMKIALAISIFVITFLLYLLPYIDGYGDYESFASVWIYLPECLGATIKQFVGESKIEYVSEYMSAHVLFVCDFYVGAFVALLFTFSTALSAFKDRIYNYFRRAKRMKSDVCDIVIGTSDAALKYANVNKNSIVYIDKVESGNDDISYIESGYTVLKKNFSVDLLKSKLFNKKTKYNFIIPDSNNYFFNYYNIISIYFDQGEIRDNLFFFLETNEKAASIIQDHIAYDKNSIYSKYLRLFSRNELLARKFVEENPVTKYMPEDFFESDTSIKKDVEINVVMLGFGELSKEIYNQHIMNNQLVEFSDGEYKCHNVNYRIYSSSVDADSWNIDGLKNTLEKLKLNREMYFPLPELPYNTTVIKQDSFEVTELAKMCKLADSENSVTYFIVDVGNIYINIDISDNINQLMNHCGNYHIFVYNNGASIQNENNVTFYGNVKDIFTNGTIVNEELVGLAKAINKYYIEKNSDCKLTDDEIENKNTDEWQKMSYFTLYSNIYFANNLRLKLNLLGLDYVKCAGIGDASALTEKYNRDEQHIKNKNYMNQDIRNAILAQEHARWNTYQMLSHYMPIKKNKIGVCDLSNCNNYEDIMQTVFDTRKNQKTKKHACVTTYNGVMEVGAFLAEKVNQLAKTDICKATDFGFFENDDIIFDKSIAVKYLETNGYKVIDRQK